MKKISYMYEGKKITRRYEYNNDGKLVIDGIILSKELQVLKEEINRKESAEIDHVK